MFSYRHGFHAGNHADVFKHTVLLAILRHLTLKEIALHVFDTHACAGLYRFDSEQARTSAEAAQGILLLIDQIAKARPKVILAPAVQDYLAAVKSFNPDGGWIYYPGSPFLIFRELRERDRLKLFELHPTEIRALSTNVAQLGAGRQVSVLGEDGFEGLRKFLPPPSRRGFVLCDPSYELKTDYVKVMQMMTDAIGRFATGTYFVWYPILARHDAQELPRKLWNLAQRSRKPWLNATLRVKASRAPRGADAAGAEGLAASGLFVINPPYTLAASLQEVLPQLVHFLGQDEAAQWALDFRQ